MEPAHFNYVEKFPVEIRQEILLEEKDSRGGLALTKVYLVVDVESDEIYFITDNATKAKKYLAPLESFCKMEVYEIDRY